MTAGELFWQLAQPLRARSHRIVAGTLMKGRCLRAGQECLVRVDYNGFGPR